MTKVQTEALTLVRCMVYAVVDDLTDVEINVRDLTETSSVIEVHVHPDDLGKVIGKTGHTARAMRTILGCMSMREGHSFSLDIINK